MFAILFSMVDLFHWPWACTHYDGSLWLKKKFILLLCILSIFIVRKDCRLLSQLKLEDKKVKLYVNQ
jgi:hypothetical protein